MNKPFFLFRPFYKKIVEHGYFQQVDGTYIPTCNHTKPEPVTLWAFMDTPERTSREIKRQIVKLQGKKFKAKKFSKLEYISNTRYQWRW